MTAPDHGDTPPRRLVFGRAVLENARGVPVGIFELARADRIDEGKETGRTQTHRDRYQKQKNIHRGPTRSALRETQIDEADMASAAASGVAMPDTATGIATAL